MSRLYQAMQLHKQFAGVVHGRNLHELKTHIKEAERLGYRQYGEVFVGNTCNTWLREQR